MCWMGVTNLLLKNSFKNIENIIIGGIRKKKQIKIEKYITLFLIDNISKL